MNEKERCGEGNKTSIVANLEGELATGKAEALSTPAYAFPFNPHHHTLRAGPHSHFTEEEPGV